MSLKLLLIIALLSSPLLVSAQGGLVPVPPPPGTAQAPLPIALMFVVNAFLILASIVASIYIIIGGVRYITTGDNEQGQEKAKQTILYAVIGLIVIGLAAVIVNFTVGAVAGGGFF